MDGYLEFNVRNDTKRGVNAYPAILNVWVFGAVGSSALVISNPGNISFNAGETKSFNLGYTVPEYDQLIYLYIRVMNPSNIVLAYKNLTRPAIPSPIPASVTVLNPDLYGGMTLEFTYVGFQPNSRINYSAAGQSGSTTSDNSGAGYVTLILGYGYSGIMTLSVSDAYGHSALGMFYIYANPEPPPAPTFCCPYPEHSGLCFATQQELDTHLLTSHPTLPPPPVVDYYRVYFRDGSTGVYNWLQLQPILLDPLVYDHYEYIGTW